MTRAPFDQFAKQFLEELLTPYGQVEISREIPGESRLIDLWFNPSPTPQGDPQDLGLLGDIIRTPCLLEPYRNPPDEPEIQSCLLKRLWVVTDLHRQQTPDPLPLLWIFTPTASPTLLDNLRATPSFSHLPGVYSTASILGTYLVVLHQLPPTPATLWLRLLGRGASQRQAIDELFALPDGPLRLQALRLLVNWKIMVDTTRLFQTEEEKTLMALSQAFLELEAKILERGLEQGLEQGIEQGLEQGIERGLEQGLEQGVEQGLEQGRRQTLAITLYNLFLARFGEVDEVLQSTIDRVINLSLEDYNRGFPQLLNLSREELATAWMDSPQPVAPGDLPPSLDAVAQDDRPLDPPRENPG